MPTGSSNKDPILVVVQLSGGNDFMNTVVPYNDSHYRDWRPSLGVAEEDILPIDGGLGIFNAASPLKEFYDKGDMAIIQGVGYANGSRSHFRSMYIWHTCEPEKLVTEGWLGKTVGEFDPNHENVLTGVNFGRGLPQAMVSKGVPVTSVGDLDNYGLMSGISEDDGRIEALDRFKEMYAPAMGTGPVMEYLSQTGLGVLSGGDILKTVPSQYKSNVEYAGNEIATSLKDVVRVLTADVGTRIFYTQHGGYDTHANQGPTHPQLISDASRAIMDFYQDLEDHDAADNVVTLVFTEFGRRVADNGSGTDHGAGGGAFLIGKPVKGGLYAEYPSLDPKKLENGEDLAHTYDFRGLYSTILEQHLGLDATPIVGGTFEQVPAFNN